METSAGTSQVSYQPPRSPFATLVCCRRLCRGRPTRVACQPLFRRLFVVCFDPSWSVYSTPWFMSAKRRVLGSDFGLVDTFFVSRKTGASSRLPGTLVGPHDECEVRKRFMPEPASEAAWDFDILDVPEYRSGRAFMRIRGETNARRHAGAACRGMRLAVSRTTAVQPVRSTSDSASWCLPTEQARFSRGGSPPLAFLRAIKVPDAEQLTDKRTT